jgi:hypothetical protein
MDDLVSVNRPRHLISLLSLVVIFFTVFILPLLSDALLHILYPLCFTIIFVLVALSLEKHRRKFVTATIVIVAAIWISTVANKRSLEVVSRFVQFLFFLYLLSRMLMQLAGSRYVSRQTFIDAITGYFLLGLSLAIMVVMVAAAFDGAYNIDVHPLGETIKNEAFRDYFYYTFVTYSTTGYGDVVPLIPLSKSLAVLIAVCGQLYIALVISLIVGKYLSGSSARTP